MHGQCRTSALGPEPSLTTDAANAAYDTTSLDAASSADAGSPRGGQKRDKTNRVLPRVSDTRRFNGFNHWARKDKNHRFWLIGFGKGFLSACAFQFA